MVESSFDLYLLLLVDNVIVCVLVVGSDSLGSMNCSPPGSSLHGFSRQDYWSGLPCSPPGDLPHPGMEPTSLTSPGLAGGIFTTSAAWETHSYHMTQQFHSWAYTQEK